ncbi:uncharacterized protein PG986_009750 [Apiospora aurea]|uniref:Uncharacterized protein n=1 Tax=Apiospora aurea TaxID=335848 RepID=A0ABR1Q8J6_9PEZI
MSDVGSRYPIQWHSNQIDCDRKPFIHASDLAQWWQMQLYFSSQFLDLEQWFFVFTSFFFLARLYSADIPWNNKKFLYSTTSGTEFPKLPGSFFIVKKL